MVHLRGQAAKVNGLARTWTWTWTWRERGEGALKGASGRETRAFDVMAQLTVHVAPAVSSSNQQGAYVIRLHSQVPPGKVPIGCWRPAPAETGWVYSAAWKQILNIEHARLSGSSISGGFHHFIVQKTNKKSILNRLALTAYSAPHYCLRFPSPCSFLGIDLPVLPCVALTLGGGRVWLWSDSDLDLDALFESSSPSFSSHRWGSYSTGCQRKTDPAELGLASLDDQ